MIDWRVIDVDWGDETTEWERFQAANERDWQREMERELGGGK